MTCTVEGCTSPKHGRGYCRAHYMRWWRYGDPLEWGRNQGNHNRIPIGTRFWSKVDFSNPNGCWLWQGSLRHYYGEVWRDGQKHYAHRVAYELVHGDLEPDIVVRHSCDAPLCVRPDHLISGTQVDNGRDMAERQRWRNQHAAGANNEPNLWRGGYSERARRRLRLEAKAAANG